MEKIVPRKVYRTTLPKKLASTLHLYCDQTGLAESEVLRMALLEFLERKCPPQNDLSKNGV